LEEGVSRMSQYIPKQNPDEYKEHHSKEEGFKVEKEKKSKRKFKFIAITAVILLVLGSWITYSFISPGKYDNFAKCLTEKGAVMYGEEWCKYTQAQKGMFGKSFKYINYQIKEDLRKRPTWVIDGNSYETVQSFERLSALTGCKF
jgi:hypothetical protein